MGDHFATLGDVQPEVAEPQVISQDEAKMKKLLSKPEVKRALEDPVIRDLIEKLKTDPTAAQKYVPYITDIYI